MKKLFSLALCVLMAVVLCVPAFAGAYDDTIKAIPDLTEFRYYEPAEIYGAEISLRGFCASQDGKYLFGGYLSGNRGVVKFDATSGDPLAVYSIPEGGGNPKSVATDDRGYVYVGLSNEESANYITVVAVEYATMTEVARVKITLNADGKAGMNGMQVVKEGDKYVLYTSVNYQHSLIAAIDVTDVNAMKVETSFGENGYLQLAPIATACAADKNFNVNGVEVHCFDIDADGNFYFAMCVDSDDCDKSNGIVKASKTGEYLGYAALIDEDTGDSWGEAYGVSYYNGYVFTCQYIAAVAKVYVFDTETMTEVKVLSLDGDTLYGELTGIVVFSDKIFVSDQRSGNKSGFWVVSNLNLPKESGTVVPPETNAPASSDAPASSEAPTDTGASDPGTNPPTGDFAIVVAAAALVAVAGAMIVTKRRRA